MFEFEINHMKNSFLQLGPFEKHIFNFIINLKSEYSKLHNFILNRFFDISSRIKHTDFKNFKNSCKKINEFMKYVKSYIRGIETTVLNNKDPIKLFFFKINNPNEGKIFQLQK